jgi:hypothetical protein
MSQSVPHLSDVQLQRLLADLSQQSGPMTAEDVQCLEDLVHRVGGIDAARELFETLQDLQADGEDVEALDEEDVQWDDDETDDDLAQAAA